MEDALIQSGGTAGLIAAIWGVAAAIKQHKEKNNGGSTYTRITILENKVSELQEELKAANEKLVKTHRDVCEFREEFRIFLTRQETREEMVFTILGLVSGCLMGSGVFGDSEITQIIGGILAAVCGSSYTMGRSLVKGKEAIGAAQVQAARELVKKQEPKS